ncbi:MAG: tRNA pseudouridine(38-40) synthase TruA [Gammaproteobacteria bacterium]
MFKYALGLEYDGRFWHGWQRQANCPTVQEALERSLSDIAGEEITTVCAGRTDKGVHALCQVVHFETAATRQDKAWVFGANKYLPTSLRVLWVKKVAPDFSARYSAYSRAYQYIIYNSKIRPALNHGRVTWLYKHMNAEAMHEAAQALLGEHDFSAFRDKACQSKSTNRNVSRISVQRQGVYVILDIEANAFLHHMVRNIVGVLLRIGYGERPMAWAKSVLDAKTRQHGGITAPADGLYLTKVRYKPEYGLGEFEPNCQILI